MKADCPVLVRDFLERVSSCPDQIAVVDREREITYRDLDRLSGRVSSFLTAQGVGPGSRVVLLIEKSIEAVAVALGTLKTGAAYVPLDPAAPAARTRKQIIDCCPAVLFLGAPSPSEVFPLPSSSRLIVEVPEGRGTPASWERILESDPEPPLASPRPEDPAYLL